MFNRTPRVRDDLISLLYSLIFLRKGTLPWVDMVYSSNDLESWEMGLEMKKRNSANILVAYDPTTKFLLPLAKYILSLNKKDQPNYEFMINCLK